MDSVRTEILYFSRDEKFDVEKPFTTSFPVDDIPDAKVDNHEFTSHRVHVHNARGALSPVLDVHGFQYVSWPTRLSRHDFDSEGQVVAHYFSELAGLLKKRFPRYKKVAFFDHEIRRRDSRYPGVKGAPTTSSQPFRFAHVDFTKDGARMKLQDALGRGFESGDDPADMRCDILNIWRLLNDKPTKDWPLSLCDWRSVDAERDLIANDVVYPRGAGENCFLRYNPQHSWWYLACQQPEEVIVFRNACLGDAASAPIAFHCAFRNPLADTTDELRESIEVRLAAFY